MERSIRLNAGTSRLRSKALPTIGLALMASAALALQATPATAAASGEWVGTVRVTQTRVETGPNLESSGPDISYQVSGADPDVTVDLVTFTGNMEFDYGPLLACHEHLDYSLVAGSEGDGPRL